MNIRRLASALGAAALMVATVGAPSSAEASIGPSRLQFLAKEQTRLLTAYDRNTGVSPTRCGEGQGRDGFHGVFLLPVLAVPDHPGPKTLRCVTTADEVLVDAGGSFVTEDAAGPSYPLPYPDGALVPFDRAHLNAICDDAVEHYLPTLGGYPAPLRVDGRVGTPVAVATRWFLARISPTLETEYAASVALGHPGVLATGYCGYKALVHLRPGWHVITVDYSGVTGQPGTVYTYKVLVKRHRGDAGRYWR